MKFSVVMLVSRTDSKFVKAVESVVRQEPNEFRAYIDTLSIDHLAEPYVYKILKDANAEILTQHPSLSFNRHENLVHNYHRAILEAKNEWVVKTDDDDQLTGTKRSDLLDRVHSHTVPTNKIGIIHGDKKVNYPYVGYLTSLQFLQFIKSTLKPSIFKGAKPHDYRDVRHKIWGGSAIINRNAFASVHPLIDHSYFYDFKTFYWILRSGWKSVYVSEILFIQNLNPTASKKRKAMWGKWASIMEKLDRIPDEKIQKIITNKSMN